MRWPGRPARRRYACPGAFESSLPGLYFTGSLAAPDFAPMLRFVAGTEFAARRVAAALSRRTSG
ncbi:hypothetical protein [Streptomyces sp. OV198]|uniref:hypothetical protein n=1 Tax=Streptomyces sp. OV198 TaxID=1882787 RepID=UPI00211CF3BC|nr:hypothetical protein [Streptomyces sp. OV198]